MSSIYRKGRDGYFYYQTYLYNSKTGKKDKKIFHSLSTKNEQEAKKRQIELDRKYVKSPKNLSKKKYFIFALAMITIMISFYLIKFSFKIKNNTYLDNLGTSNLAPSQDSIGIDLDNQNSSLETGPKKQKVLSNVLHSDTSTSSPEFQNKMQVPNYKIERTEIIAEVFNQCKLYVTTESTMDDKALLAICELLTKQYSSYKNIIICIYKDNSIGKDLAIGNSSYFSQKDIIDSWLVMYSYNPVEGSYFDNTPGRYLGVY